jgi:VWFA-related protein
MLLLLAAIAVPVFAHAQFGEQISVRIVTLPVLARGGGGRPVMDLEASEVTVREGKKTYRVESLTRYLTEPGSRRELPRVRLITQLDGNRRQVAVTAATEPRYMVLVIDVETDPPVERKRATDALKRFLENELDPSFQVALLLFDGEVRQLVPFTQDRQVVTAALDRVHGERKARARLAPGTQMRQLLDRLPICAGLEPSDSTQCLRDSAIEYASEVTQTAHRFVDALESIVGYVEGLEGHKSVLVVGGNVSFNPAREATEAVRAIFGHSNEITELEQSLQSEEPVRPRLDELFARAFRNRVSISFIDRTPAPSDVSARQGQQFQPGFRPMSTAHQAGQGDLSEIAAATGGSFIASTRVDEGLRQSMALMESAYELSIRLPDNEPLTPRRLRRISIQTSRPGVRMTHQRGFEGARKEEPAVSLRGTIEAGHLVRQEIDGTAVNVIPLRFVFDTADLGYEEKENQAAAQFTVHLRLRTADGVLLTDAYRVLMHSYPLDLWRKRDIEPPAMLAFADVPPGDYVAEAVVTIPRLGRHGVLRRTFTATAPAAEETTAVAVAIPTPNVPVAPVAVPRPREARAEIDREYRPSIAFASHFLGVVTGIVDVSVIVGGEIASVELLLDGNRIGVMEREPWTLAMNLGEVPSPRELVAVGHDARGREISRVRQWLNLPRPWTELEVVLSDAGGGAFLGQIALQSVGGERPRQVIVTLDGATVSISNSPKFRLPAVDRTNIHIVHVEAQFEKAGTVSRDVVIGGRYVQEASAELSSVALQVPGIGDVRLDDVKIQAGGKPVSVVALERGAADVIVVVDPRAINMLPGVAVTETWTSLLPNMDMRLTPAETDVHLRLLWPVADEATESRAGQIGYRLFPSTDPDASSGGGFLWHVAGAAFPAGNGAVRLADAVAVAGPMALERGRRRAVLLVLGGSPTEGEYSAAAARAYLEQLRVPLIVWSTGTPTRSMLDEWGNAAVVSTQHGLRNAWLSLIRKLDRQRVAWLEGMALPQTLEAVGKKVELAGAPLR